MRRRRAEAIAVPVMFALVATLSSCAVSVPVVPPATGTSAASASATPVPSTTAPSVAASSASAPAVGQPLASSYQAAGGSTAMGAALGPAQQVQLGSADGYAQRFASLSQAGGVSTVVWNSDDPDNGWATTVNTPNPRLDKVENERDPLAATGLAQGMVYRTAELNDASTSDKLDLAGLLAGGVVIDLRSAGTKDPELPGVTELRYPMTSTTDLTTFVSTPSDRESLGKALQAVAAAVSSGHPALIHCHAGRDRTGWASAVLESLLGASGSLVRNDYLASPDTRAQRLADALAAVASAYPDASLHGATYPGIYRYVTEGLGLSAEQVAELRAALA